MSKDPSRFERVRRVVALRKQLERGLIKEIPNTWVGRLLLKELGLKELDKSKGVQR